jgi:hypothetical protein
MNRHHQPQQQQPPATRQTANQATEQARRPAPSNASTAASRKAAQETTAHAGPPPTASRTSQPSARPAASSANKERVAASTAVTVSSSKDDEKTIVQVSTQPPSLAQDATNDEDSADSNTERFELEDSSSPPESSKTQVATRPEITKITITKTSAPAVKKTANEKIDASKSTPASEKTIEKKKKLAKKSVEDDRNARMSSKDRAGIYVPVGSVKSHAKSQLAPGAQLSCEATVMIAAQQDYVVRTLMAESAKQMHLLNPTRKTVEEEDVSAALASGDLFRGLASGIWACTTGDAVSSLPINKGKKEEIRKAKKRIRAEKRKSALERDAKRRRVSPGSKSRTSIRKPAQGRKTPASRGKGGRKDRDDSDIDSGSASSSEERSSISGEERGEEEGGSADSFSEEDAADSLTIEERTRRAEEEMAAAFKKMEALRRSGEARGKKNVQTPSKSVKVK